jgi:pilus assembly protein CpaC
MKKIRTVTNNWLTTISVLLTVLVLVLGVPSQAIVGIAATGDDAEINILHRQSQILPTPWPVARVAVTDPLVADIKVLTADQVLIQGLAIGTTDIILWSEDETQVLQKKVNVVMDVDKIRAQMGDLFPSSSLQFSESGENLIVRGSHRNAIQATQLQDYLTKSNIAFIDMTDVAGVQQVELQVRVAEVSKTGLRKMGSNWLQAGNDFSSGISPKGGITSAGFADGAGFVEESFGESVTNTSVLRDFGVLNTVSGSGITAFGILPRADMAFFLEALAENQYLRLLANPTLIAISGEEASFLAGGEFPVPVIQSSGSGGTSGGSAITIEYKEYGVRLSFKPIVLGDGTIRMFVYPEVSELDNANGTTVNGTFVPGILARKAQSTFELKSGQSFAMAGLLSESSTAMNSRVPGLGDLPVLGPLFRSVEYQNKESELVILVTANLVEPLNIDPKKTPLPGFMHEAPNDWELYIDGDIDNYDLAKLDEIDAEWLKHLGLNDLHGPGAWDEYGEATPVSRAEIHMEE